MQVIIHQVTIDMQGLNGKCNGAVKQSLLHKTVLLVRDLSTAKLLETSNRVKAKQSTVFATTCFMAAQDATSDRITEALHASEGAVPLPLESLPDTPPIDDETTPIDEELTPSKSHHQSQMNLHHWSQPNSDSYHLKPLPMSHPHN